MKIAVFVFAACLIVVPSVRAQTRILIGATGADSFGNLSLGVSAGVEIPVKRFELDINDVLSPLETHTALGSGTANLIQIGGSVWPTKKFGLQGSVEYSNYVVTTVSKGAYYYRIGPAFRMIALGAPTQFTVSYIRQFRNGVSNGIETSHLSGGEFRLDTRFGCSGPVCFRISEAFQVGRVWEQGNPECDGSLGPDTCGSRLKAVSGGVEGSFRLEFPRHRGHENEF